MSLKINDLKDQLARSMYVSVWSDSQTDFLAYMCSSEKLVEEFGELRVTGIYPDVCKDENYFSLLLTLVICVP
jgi:hypothetical protein